MAALGFGWCGQRAQGQTIAETLSFSIICQYVTNTFTTNHAGEVFTDQHLLTVIIDTPNIVKALAIDMFTNGWTNWSGASLVYEENMTTGNQGLYLRFNIANRQTNVTKYFVNSFSTNSYANMFSQDVTNAFVGTLLPTNFSTNGYTSVYTQDPTNTYNDTNFPPDTLPLSGEFGYNGLSIGTAYDNLTYLTLMTSNISLSLFGYSQGTLIRSVYDKEGDVGTVDKAQIVGAGTFSLNLTTNFLFRTNGFPISTNITSRGANVLVVTNVTPPVYGIGIAHGTVMVGGSIYRLDIGPPEGP